MITLKQLLENNKEKTLNKTKQSEAYDKMKKWHNGTRKQNVGALSDVKLKFNYKVCKELGFEKEMELLQKEAQKRNIEFAEMLSISDYININENNNVTPDVFYHATTSNVVPSIRKYGLGGKISKQRFWDYEDTKYKDIKQGVFLATDEYVAYDFLDSSEEYYDFKEEYDENHERELEIVVYEIKASDLDKSKLSIDTNNDEDEEPTYFYDCVIDYKKLKRIKSENF